jgi:hypothetical protein
VIADSTSSIPATTSSTTTTTVAPTTTTMLATTTTLPTADLQADVAIYDDFTSAALEEGAPCNTSTSVYSFVSANTGFLLIDPNTQETLAVGRLGPGELRHEFGPSSDLPTDVFDIFWYCNFPTELSDVPLDRDFYFVRVEGDANGVTYDGDDVEAERYVGITYFFTDAEAVRDTYR